LPPAKSSGNLQGLPEIERGAEETEHEAPKAQDRESTGSPAGKGDLAAQEGAAESGSAAARRRPPSRTSTAQLPEDADQQARENRALPEKVETTNQK